MKLTQISTVRVAVAISAFATQAALAAGDAHGEGGPDVFSGNIFNAIWTLVTFGGAIAILGTFLWPLVLRVLKNREEFIRESLHSAKRDREEAEKLIREHREQIENARHEATAIVEEGRRDAEVLRKKIQEDAKEEAEKIIERARREIQIARDSAVKDLYTMSGQLATDLAGKILQKELDAGSHDRLIQESLEQIHNLSNGGSRN